MKWDRQSLKTGLIEAVRKYGLILLLIASLPVGIYLARAARPDPVRPYRSLATPGDVAVHADGGPGVPAAPVRTATPLPKFVKGIYVTASTAGTKSRFEKLVSLVERTELNAMVIDVKEGDGRLAFAPQSSDLKPLAAKRPELGDLPTFTAPLKAKGIYLIARIPVFEDAAFVAAFPQYAVQSTAGGIWRNRRGSVWIDPAAVPAWKYDAAVAREAYDGGFDEVQFDYIRFPSDGNLKTVKYPFFPAGKTRWQQMAEFFTYLDRELRVRSGIPLSVDLFGLTMVQHETDMGIGQRLRDALPHFDFISPMVYPSHYAAGFEGYGNPADHPYEVVNASMKKGNELTAAMKQDDAKRLADNPAAKAVPLAGFRPWLQDFNMGAVYDAAMVQAQMRAAAENGATGWLLWNAGNVYTEAALVKEQK